MRADNDRLSAFLDEAAALRLRLAFEFRHESWFQDATFRILEQHGTALCVAESDELKTPDVRTAPFSCYRLRRSDYSADEIRAMAHQFQEQTARADVFAYFKHEELPTGALRAVALRAALEEPAS